MSPEEKVLELSKFLDPRKERLERIHRLETALHSCVNELYRLKDLVGEVDQLIIDGVISDAEKELGEVGK